MPAAHLIVFDDGQGRFGPMVDLRSTFNLRTGARTTLGRIERVMDVKASALWVARPELLPIVRWQSGLPVNQLHEDQQATLCVNGRWLAYDHVAAVRDLPVNSALVQPDGQIIAAHLSNRDAASMLNHDELPASVETTIINDDRALITRPWHILDALEPCLKSDLAQCDHPTIKHGERGASVFGGHRVHVAANAIVQPGVVFNAERGPIVVADGALLGALSILEGPCFIGHDSQVVAHAHIRPNTVVGPVCKAAGEISHSIMQSHSNKAHHGYMGHALIGQWVNIGAATNMSNLKNTYGNVRMQLEPGSELEDTGRTFHGPIICDYVRTAISTRLTTGTVIGTGAMVATAGYPSRHVRRFAFLTDRGATFHESEKFITTAKRMMARRNMEMTRVMENRLRLMSAEQMRMFHAA